MEWNVTCAHYHWPSPPVRAPTWISDRLRFTVKAFLRKPSRKLLLLQKVMECCGTLGMSGVGKFFDISQPRLLKRGTHVVEV
jgi:hypothetical protein